MDRSNIRTFNSAKKFAEEVLHPLIKSHTEAKIRSRLGAISDEEAIKLPPKVRVIKRYNALKERIIILQTLLTEVEPTIRLNSRKSEIALIELLSEQLSMLEDAYDTRSDEILEGNDHNFKELPKLTPLFKEIGQYLDRIYVQIQRIMTKNKLLFFGDDNEFVDNEDLMERIKAENRNS